MNRIDLDRMRALAADGYLHIQEHPEGGLLILNYSPKTQYEGYWTPETLMARGLITDLAGEIQARPFEKFFNLGERALALPNESFEVFEKLDGSLGILYFLNGKPRVATRGSFSSEQAARANLLLAEKYPHVPFQPSLTYLFEILYPQNRIVVDYGGLEDLVLLAIVETQTGLELPIPEDFPMPVVRRYHGIRDIQELLAMEESNREGFVVRFSSGFRVKIKFEEYKRLHRVLTGLSAHSIWENVSEGKDLGQVLEWIPDEYYDWVKETESDLLMQYQRIENQSKADFKVLGTRKETAQYFLIRPHPHILFRMLDGKDYAPLIWAILEPSRSGKPFGKREEKA